MNPLPLFLAGLIALPGTLSANDDSYEIRVGYGINKTILAPASDGRWQHPAEGLDNRIDNTGKVFVVQLIGKTNLDWLGIGIGYAYREGATASGAFVDDPCYATGTYSGGPVTTAFGTTMPNCDRRFYAKSVSSKTNAFTFTVNPTLKVTADFSLIGALGLSYHHTQNRIEWDYSKGVFSTPGVLGDSVQNEHKAVGYFEGGVKYKRVSLILYTAKERAPEGMGDGQSGLIAAVSF